MKKLLVSSLLLFLMGCTTVSTDRKFPDVPNELKVACPGLQLIDPATTKLSEVISVVTTNYGQYQECQIKVDAWIEWYTTQKNIFNSVK